MILSLLPASCLLVLLTWVLLSPAASHPLVMGSVQRFFSSCDYDDFKGEYDLFVGADQQFVGTVQLDFSGTDLAVNYDLTTGCKLTEAQVDVVQETTSKPIPGKFACKVDSSVPTNSLQLTCPLSDFDGIQCCNTFFVYTHAALVCGEEEETAYGGEPSCSLSADKPERGGKSKWCNVISIEPPCSRNNLCECVDKCTCPSTSPTPSVSPSVTPSSSISSTPSATPSISVSPSPSVTPSISVSPSPSVTPSISMSPSSSVTPSISVSPSSSVTPSISMSPSSSVTPSISVSPSSSVTPSISVSPSSSVTPSISVSPSSSVTPSISVSPSSSVTPSISVSPSSSVTPSTSISATSSPSISASPSASISSSPSETPSASMTSTPSISASPSASISSSPSETPSASMTSTPSISASPSASISSSPSETPSASMTSTPSISVSSVPSMSASPSADCDCPNCFICVGIKDDGSPDCQPDDSTNDAECNPCEGPGANKLCTDAGLDPEFKCCPNTSKCKQITIPGRLNVTQSSLPVSFICSRNCGTPCDEEQSPGSGTSNACSLFAPLDLTTDGDPDTDDIFNECPEVPLDN